MEESLEIYMSCLPTAGDNTRGRVQRLYGFLPKGQISYPSVLKLKPSQEKTRWYYLRVLFHKDNLRHLSRFPDFFVTFRILSSVSCLLEEKFLSANLHLRSHLTTGTLFIILLFSIVGIINSISYLSSTFHGCDLWRVFCWPTNGYIFGTSGQPV